MILLQKKIWRLGLQRDLILEFHETHITYYKFWIFYFSQEINLYHGPNSRVASDYRINVVTQETDEVKTTTKAPNTTSKPENNGSYQYGNYKLTWEDEGDQTAFTFTSQSSRLFYSTNSWYAVAFSNDNKMVDLKFCLINYFNIVVFY